jgi:hypothetical protein
MTFAGSDAYVFPYMQKAGLRPTGQRIYLNEKKYPGDVPKHWPVVAGNPAHACVSIRPDLDELLKGNLDHDLARFLGSAPGGPTSLLGLWHEASTGGPAGIYKKVDPAVTGPKLRAAQARVQKLARRAKANVKVGAIDVVGIARPAEWMARDLDFYACDIYDNRQCTAQPYPMLGKFRDQCDRLMSSGPAVIAVAETNSRRSGRRPFWFHTVWAWLQEHGYTSNTSCFLTFWRLNAPESGGWRPNDKATIAALKEIFAQSSP